jgi:large subunit ribosomal protein L24e
MAKCSFCSSELSQGCGKMIVKNDGRILFFCCKKCEKNMHMGRNPARVNWIRKAKAPSPK